MRYITISNISNPDNVESTFTANAVAIAERIIHVPPSCGSWLLFINELLVRPHAVSARHTSQCDCIAVLIAALLTISTNIKHMLYNGFWQRRSVTTLNQLRERTLDFRECLKLLGRFSWLPPSCKATGTRKGPLTFITGFSVSRLIGTYYVALIGP